MAIAIMDDVSQFMFCSFMALFVLPLLVSRLFYYIPGILYYSAKKKMRLRAVWLPLRDIVVWGLIAAAAYAAAYLIEPAIFWELAVGPLALLCWGMGLLRLGWILATKRRREWQDAFYQNIVLRYSRQ